MTPSVTAVRMTGPARGRCRCWSSARRSAPRPPRSGRPAAAGLTDAFDVVAWDLPGHGTTARSPTSRSRWPSSPRASCTSSTTCSPSAASVGGGFAYAGDSVGGAVGLQLMLDAPGPGHRGRAALHRRPDRRPVLLGRPDGTGQGVRDPGSGLRVGRALVRGRLPRAGARAGLRAAARAAVTPTTRATSRCASALAAFDVRDRLGEVDVPVLAVAGAEDVATPPASCTRSRRACRTGGYVELDGVAHLAPAEAPDAGGPADPGARAGRAGPQQDVADDRPCARSATRAWSYAVRCWATRTSTAPPPRPPTSPATSRSSSRSTPGAASGPAPASTVGAAR